MKIFYGEVFKALNKTKVKYVVAGGTAVVFHGYHHYKGKLDLVILFDEKNISQLVDIFETAGYIPKTPVTDQQNSTIYSFVQKDSLFKVIEAHVGEDFARIYKRRISFKAGKMNVPIADKEDLERINKKQRNRVYPHLDVSLKRSYSQRFQLLTEAINWVRLLEENKITRPASK